MKKLLTDRFAYKVVIIFYLLPFLAFADNSELQEKNLSKPLIVGSELDYFPFAMQNKKGEADGFSVELFKAVAQVMGFEVKFRVGPWNEVRRALEKGEIDALPLVSYSEKREKVFDFTTPHTVSYAAIFVRKGEETIHSEEELQGKKIIVMQGDATHDYLIKHYFTHNQHIHLVKTVSDALRLLASGQEDFALVPRLVGLITAKELNLTNIEMTGPKINVYGRGYGFAVKDGNTVLLAHLNQGLSIVKASGQYDEIYDKWFGIVDPRGISMEIIYQYATLVLSVFLVILSIAFLWSWSLRREIKQRKLAEKFLQKTNDELQQAKNKAETSNKAKSTFLANMSHELRTPLHAILGFTDLIKRDSTTSPSQLENLDIISHSGEHLLALINDVLEMSKIEAGRATFNEESVDLHQLLKDIAEMMRIRAKHKGLQFILEHEPTLEHFITTDAGKLRQILINFIGNAIKFTKNGGVSLRVHSQKQDTDRKCQLFFEIEDTGIGIAEQDLKTIFDPFIQVGKQRAGSEGTGLGLPITRHDIQMLGGQLEVTSQLGEGSLFKFFISVLLAKADDIEKQTSLRRIVGLSPKQPVPRILIVEDIRENRLLLKKMLLKVGFEIQEAVDGQEAITAFEQWHPALICMDMRMPVMDGYEATKRIKTSTAGKEIVIMALTASIFKEEKAKVMAAGCDDFLRKPYREEELLAMIGKHLNIEYLYEEVKGEKTDSVEVTLDDKSMLTAWLALSDDVKNELNQALKELDIDLVDSAIKHIAEQNTDLAKAMQPYVDGFQYEQLANLLSTEP